MGAICSKDEDDDSEYAYDAALNQMQPGAGIAAMLQHLPPPPQKISAVQKPSVERKMSNSQAAAHLLAMQQHRRQSHVAMAGLGIAMQHAGAFMGAAAQFEQGENQAQMEAKIRQAKQNMQTISVKDGCLFIDYKYIGPIPHGMSVRG